MALLPDPHVLFADIPLDCPIVVAVSGGSDSIALLHLASSWAKSCGADLRVVTVDHGLRPEAAAEAGFVSGICEGLRLQHYTLAWEGIKPTTGVSEAARNARYMLIEEFASDIGASIVLTGHTMDDQAETLWMRNSRDGGNPQIRGLSGMAPRMVLPHGVAVVRPLLKTRRCDLRSYLSGLGQSWVEDPSNHDASYERVRARRALTKSDIGVELISRFAGANGRLREMRSNSVATLLIEHLIVSDGPVYSIDLEVLFNCIHDDAVMAVQIMIAMAGGKEFLVASDVAQACLKMEPAQRMTGGGCVIGVRKGTLYAYRENRNLPTIRLEPGERKLWDNRLLVNNKTGQSFICRAMDRDEIRQAEIEGEHNFGVSPRAVLQSMPVLFNAMEGPVLPFISSTQTIDGLTWELQFPAIEFYCASFDLPLIALSKHVKDQLGKSLPLTDKGFKAP